MKKIEAIIKLENFEGLKTALEGAGCADLMASEIQDYGKHMEIVQIWRGREYRVAQSMMKLEAVVEDHEAAKIVQLILASAPEKSRSGRVLVYSIAEDYEITGVPAIKEAV
jgi:nitrogen regulatory protein PII